MPDVVIVGGGVIGCATAFYLAGEGASVTVIERGEIGSEASGAAAGMLAALSDEGGDLGADFQSLCIDSFDLYEGLMRQLEPTGIDLRYRSSGIIHLAMTESEATELRRRFLAQQEIAPENQWLEGAEITVLEPGASPEAIAGLYSPREHYLDPRRLVQAFSEAARSRGVTFLTRTAVTGMLGREGSLRGVQTASGEIEAGTVLLACGPWTAELAAELGSHVPVRPVRGQMIALRGPEQPLQQIIWGHNAYLIPREDGQTFVGATVEDAGFDKQNTDEGLAALRQSAAELAPELASADTVRSWAGLRPASPDGLPIMGQVPGWENAWVSTGHYRNGILLSPISGQLLSASILAGRPEPRLAPFSPARFVS